MSSNFGPVAMFKTAFRYLFGKTACKMYPKKPATSFEATRGHISFDPSTCILCTLCAKNCPVGCITGEPKKLHILDSSACIKCGICYDVCNFEAVIRR